MFKRIFESIKNMSEDINNCKKGCCTIKICKYKIEPIIFKRKENCPKAGVFIYDPDEDRVLIVQSRGILWGCPKGTIETDKKESSLECAIREVKEETGLDINGDKFTKLIKINRAIYYYTEMKTVEVFVQNEDKFNDANGITWIKVDCLEDCIKDGIISLNRHAIIAFRRFIDKSLSLNIRKYF